MTPLDRELANLSSCVRCGQCLPRCPTYVLTGLEEESPRGRIITARMLAEDRIGITPDLVRHQLSCLLCESCTDACPAGVRMEEIGVAVREVIKAGRHGPWRARVTARALRLLTRRAWTVRAAWALRAAQRLGLVRLAGALRLLRLVGLDQRSLPTVPRVFVEPGDGWRPADGRPDGRAVLFAGCLMSTLFAPLDVATGELLAAAGFEAEVRPGQGCCGALSAHQGDLDVARQLARANIAALDGDDTLIVVNAAGCSAFLKEYGHYFGESGGRIAARVTDLSEILASARFKLEGSALRGPVAFQDPCHLRLAQGISSAPRQLLRRIPGLELTELSEPHMCCGSAGVYNVTNRRTARELARRKAADILRSGAATVVTANPGCLMQLSAALREAGSDIPVVHIAQILRESCPAQATRYRASADPPPRSQASSQAG